MPDRPISFRMELSPDEHAMLRALCERDGLTASAYLRVHIRKTHAATFGDDAPRGNTKTSKKKGAHR